MLFYTLRISQLRVACSASRPVLQAGRPARPRPSASLSDCESATKLANRLLGLSGEIANFLPHGPDTCHLERAELSRGGLVVKS